MKFTYPYEIKITSKQELEDFYMNMCIDCPKRISNWECSAYQFNKCDLERQNIVKQFMEYLNEKSN